MDGAIHTFLFADLVGYTALARACPLIFSGEAIA